MNTLLSVANGIYSYYRAKKNGVWGIVGIAVALLLVFNWNLIEPLFEKIGIVSLLNNLGLVVPGDAGLTGYKILFAAASISFLVMVFGTALIILSALLMVFLGSKVGSTILIVGISIFLIPIMFVYGLIFYPFIRLFRKNYNQLPKNEEVIITLINADNGADESSSKPNVLSKEGGYKVLNHLPMQNEKMALLAINRSRDIYLVLPRPLALHTNEYPKEALTAYKLQINIAQEKHRYMNYNIKSQAGTPSYYEELKRREAMPYLYNISNKDTLLATTLLLDDINMFIDPFRSYDIREVIEKLCTSVEYRNYATKIQEEYFKVVDTWKQLMEYGTSAEFIEAARTLKEIQVGNEEVVSLLI